MLGWVHDCGNHTLLNVPRLASVTPSTLLMLQSTAQKDASDIYIDFLHAYCLHPYCPQPTYCLYPTSCVRLPVTLDRCPTLRLRHVYKDMLAGCDAIAAAWRTR